MGFFKKNKKQEGAQPEEGQEMGPLQRFRSDMRALVEKVSYKGIVNNIPYLAFLAMLCLVYISNSQRAIETQREINKKEKILKELRWKYMDIKGNLMRAQMEAEVIRSAAAIGLKPLILPPYKITDSITNRTENN